MKTRPRSESASPREVIHTRAWKQENFIGKSLCQLQNMINEMAFLSEIQRRQGLIPQCNPDPPKVSLNNVELRLNMEQVDGLFKEQNSPERQRNNSLKGTPPVTRRGPSFLVWSFPVLMF
jgi:hypothetical protein